MLINNIEVRHYGLPALRSAGRFSYGLKKHDDDEKPKERRATVGSPAAAEGGRAGDNSNTPNRNLDTPKVFLLLLEYFVFMPNVKMSLTS